MVRFIQNGKEIKDSEAIQFPITEVGKSSTVSFTIENNTDENVELAFWSDDGDLKPVVFPQFLKPGESQGAQVKFSPPLDRPDSLNTHWGFREILG